MPLVNSRHYKGLIPRNLHDSKFPTQLADGQVATFEQRTNPRELSVLAASATENAADSEATQSA